MCVAGGCYENAVGPVVKTEEQRHCFGYLTAQFCISTELLCETLRRSGSLCWKRGSHVNAGNIVTWVTAAVIPRNVPPRYYCDFFAQAPQTRELAAANTLRAEGLFKKGSDLSVNSQQC